MQWHGLRRFPQPITNNLKINPKGEIMPDGVETRKFIGANNNALIADCRGNPDHPPVVFLHGGGQTRHAWGGTAAKIADAGWHAIAVDLRGHGESDWTEQYGRTDFGGDIIKIVARIIEESGTPPLLVGASLGGISSPFAEDMTDGPLSRALILVDIAPRTNPAGVERILNFMAAGADGFATIDDAADAVAGYLRERSRPKDVTGLRKNLRLKPDGRWYWHWDPRFLERPVGSREQDAIQLEAAARRLNIPTLLVRGGKSDVLTEDGIEAFLEMVPQAKFVDIAGAGHMGAGDKNDAFTDAILGFAADLEKAATVPTSG
jgi:pimeloyl-ACP methyl ester carboxylesterase